MKTTEQAQQKAISTPTLIILIAGLAVLGYMLLQPLFAPQEQAAAPSAPAVSAAQPVAAPAADPVSVGTKLATGQTALSKGDFSEASARDPFLPSAMWLKSVPGKNESEAPSPVSVKPVMAPSVEKVETKTAITTSETALAWKGVVGSGPNQVVMIRRNNRTYTLHLGDLIPGTDYILAEVLKDSVLLISPQEQKRLFKKKEVK
jgi:hypothetical protein